MVEKPLGARTQRRLIFLTFSSIAGALGKGGIAMQQAVKRTMRQRMEEKLSAAFAPEILRVTDESHKHAGHAGHSGGAGHGGETHFHIHIVSANFAGKSRIERHRSINAALADEFADGVHALALDVRAPGER
jgi:BolA protein